MFSIGIRYLCGWSMATHPSDRFRCEWPPHPDRIFQALAAAHFETDGDRAEYESLRWLCALPSPELNASPHSERTTPTSFVPANGNSAVEVSEKGGSLLPHTWGLNRPRVARAFPVAVPEVDVVHLIWPGSDAPPETHQALAGLCRKVTAVGHSASLVQVWVDDAPPQTSTHRPTARLGAAERLRVPGPGRLEELSALYPEMRPSPTGWTGYERVESPTPARPAIRETVFAPDLVVLCRVDGRRLGLETTLILTEALRGAVMARCQVQPPPDWISGHEGSTTAPSQKPHIAFLPLAHVGRQHAEGHLLGLALAIPKDVSIADQNRCLSSFLFDDRGEPRAIELRLGVLGTWGLRIEDREDRPLTLRPEIWTGSRVGSGPCCWASVTPIVLDRYPKTPEDSELTIRRACVRIGLPEPTRVVVTPAPLFEGAPHARNAPPLTTGPNKARRFHTHALIEFSEPVRGPVLLGAGRYRGYGLCRPWPGEVG